MWRMYKIQCLRVVLSRHDVLWGCLFKAQSRKRPQKRYLPRSRFRTANGPVAPNYRRCADNYDDSTVMVLVWQGLN